MATGNFPALGNGNNTTQDPPPALVVHPEVRDDGHEQQEVDLTPEQREIIDLRRELAESRAQQQQLQAQLSGATNGAAPNRALDRGKGPMHPETSTQPVIRRLPSVIESW